MEVLWLDDVRADDVAIVGGKGASLGEMTFAGLPVPSAFVVTAETYRSFIQETGIQTELFEIVDVDTNDSKALAAATERAQALVRGTALPDSLCEAILDAYHQIGDETPVAVRSSASAEDLPSASFAGQQETYLNVGAADLLERIRDCWASLFTQRAIYYRQNQGFDHSVVDMAVVVQEMIDADKSGVLFTSHPSTGAPVLTVEAAWGLGEAVVSGAVTPDNYVVDRATGDPKTVYIADKKVMHVRDPETGETVEREVPEDKRTERVLTEAELQALSDLGAEIEAYYGTPQDIEWAIKDGEVYLLQSRPITTIDESAMATAEESVSGSADGSGGVSGRQGGVQSGHDEERIVLWGLGASPGRASGEVAVLHRLDQLDEVEAGDIMVTEMTTPDMVPAMKRAAGIVTDEGGMTCHAAIVARELGVPAIVGAGNATGRLSDGQVITIDGDRGAIEVGGEVIEPPDPVEEARPDTPVKPMTATEVKVNVSIPEAAERAAATGADGVGLLRLEHMILTLGKTPQRYIDDHGADAYVAEIVDGVERVADEFYPRPVRVRTLDAPTDEFRQMQGGENEPHEHNPMLGYRGIRRSLDRPDAFAHELAAFRKLYEMGYDNVEIMLPLVNDADDVLAARDRFVEAGIDTDRRTWGVMIETPAAALSADAMADAGIDFASFGTNDLTQYTLAVDRNNERVADQYDELHPAVLELIAGAIETCRERDVAISICGQAGSKPQMVRHLVENGITSISANIDAVRDVQHEVKRVEQQLLLDSVR
jgi:pyruvate,water dikinase